MATRHTRRDAELAFSLLGDVLERLYDTCGVKAKGLHIWRHSFATAKLRAGVPMHAVSRLLGHA